MAFNQTYHNVGNVINIETLSGNLTLGADGSAADFVAAVNAVRERLDAMAEIDVELRAQLSAKLEVDEQSAKDDKQGVAERLESVADTLGAMDKAGSAILDIGKTIASLAKWVVAIAL